MFSLTYAMLTQTLQRFRYSGEFHATVPSQTSLKGGGRVVLVVCDGKVESCAIFDKNSQKLYHDANALAVLARLGVLDWKLIASSPPSAENKASSAEVKRPFSSPPVENKALSVEVKRPSRKESFYPRRVSSAQSQMHAWPVLHRSIYMLADGSRSIEQIATILSRHPQVVAQIIYDLQIAGSLE